MRLSLLKDFYIACCISCRDKAREPIRHTQVRSKVKVMESELTHLENVYEDLVKKKEIGEEQEEIIVAKLQALKQHLDENYLQKITPRKRVTKKKMVVKKRKLKK